MISAGSQGDDLVRNVHITRANRAQVLIINGGRRTGDQTLPALVEALQLYELEAGRAVLISQAGLPFVTIAYANRECPTWLAGLAYHDRR
jgi:LacI family transcriptional regulator